MKDFFIGLIIGFLCLFIQLQYNFSIEIWLWSIGIISLIYMIATAFILTLMKLSFAFVGFLIGTMVSLFIWMMLTGGNIIYLTIIHFL